MVASHVSPTLGTPLNPAGGRGAGETSRSQRRAQGAQPADYSARARSAPRVSAGVGGVSPAFPLSVGRGWELLRAPETGVLLQTRGLNLPFNRTRAGWPVTQKEAQVERFLQPRQRGRPGCAPSTGLRCARPLGKGPSLRWFFPEELGAGRLHGGPGARRRCAGLESPAVCSTAPSRCAVLVPLL